jgi:hypothetical protein
MPAAVDDASLAVGRGGRSTNWTAIVGNAMLPVSPDKRTAAAWGLLEQRLSNQSADLGVYLIGVPSAN